MCNCVLADPDDETRSQQVEFVGVEQKDGSVIVDVSSVADRLENFESEKGKYNLDDQTIVFESVEAAKQGFNYWYDTAAVLVSRSASSLMPVRVSVTVQSYDNEQTVPPITDQGNDTDNNSKADDKNGKDDPSVSPETSDNLAPYALIIGAIALVAVIGIVVSLIVRARSKR